MAMEEVIVMDIIPVNQHLQLQILLHFPLLLLLVPQSRTTNQHPKTAWKYIPPAGPKEKFTTQHGNCNLCICASTKKNSYYNLDLNTTNYEDKETSIAPVGNLISCHSILPVKLLRMTNVLIHTPMKPIQFKDLMSYLLLEYGCILSMLKIIWEIILYL